MFLNDRVVFSYTFIFFAVVCREVGINKADAEQSSGNLSAITGCRQETQRWYQSGAGMNAASGVKQAVAEMSSEVFGYYALQLGALAQQYDLLSDSRISNCFSVASGMPHVAGVDLIAEPSALPVEFDNVDLVVACHVLDCADDPHQILREIERVLVPEGHCILIGYNPFSWRGMVLFWKRLYQKEMIPTVYSSFRLKDWFNVLGFEVLEIRTTGFRERPGESKWGKWGNWLKRFSFLKTLSAHYRRLFGNVRLIHVRKKVSKMTPIRPSLRTKPLLKPGMAVNGGGVGKSINKTVNRVKPQGKYNGTA